MLYIPMIFILCSGYYTFTFGLSMWKEKNRLGGLSTMIVAVLGTVLPAVMLYIQST